MKILFLITFLLAPSVVFSDTKNITDDLENRHAQIFADVVKAYCMKFRETPAELEAKLEGDGFKKNESYDDTFQKHIESVDYAVTPDIGFCTTDVLLKPASTMLFEIDQIDAVFISKLNLKLSKSTIDYELSIEDKRTKVIKREYVDGLGTKYLLVYPLENQDEYYMTFDVVDRSNNAVNKVD